MAKRTLRATAANALEAINSVSTSDDDDLLTWISPSTHAPVAPASATSGSSATRTSASLCVSRLAYSRDKSYRSIMRTVVPAQFLHRRWTLAINVGISIGGTMTRRIHTLFAAGLAFALSAAVVSVQAGQAQEQKPKPHDMTGCLEKGETATTWKLTNVEGGKVKLVEISETAADLKMAPHVGHKITITGTALPGKPAGEHHMRVDAVKMVSQTCP